MSTPTETEAVIPNCELRSPYEDASIFSVVFYTWMNSLIELGAKRPLELKDIFPLPRELESRRLFDQVQENWKKEISKRGPDASLLQVLFWSFWQTYCFSVLAVLPYIIVSCIQPFFVMYLLEFISTGEVNFIGMTNGIGIAALLGVISMACTFSFSHNFMLLSWCGMSCRIAVMAMIYDKSAKLSARSRGQHTVGALVTMMSADTERIWLGIVHTVWLWAGPLMLIIAMLLLLYVAGISAIAAIVTTILVTMLQTEIGRQCGVMRSKLVVFTDERVKVTNELLQGIRVIKLYAWEKPMRDKLDAIRKKEVHFLSIYQNLKGLNTAVVLIGPMLISFALFVCFVQLDEKLTVSRVYAIFAFLNIIRFPIALTQVSYTNCAEAQQSLDRISKFLFLEEIEEVVGGIEEMNEPTKTFTIPEGDDEDKKKDVVVEIKNADFTWDASNKDAPPTLKNINLEISRGEFVAIVGSVGAGKSSLISAMLGQMTRTRGKQRLNASVAYVGQEHWIQNMTLCDNILFGAPMDKELYANVLDASQMTKDLLILPHGDYTSIGERGINLSGGQKARVSIARALYCTHSEMYIFDDSLAAVDVHVGSAIFKEALQGMLAGKTRIVVLSSNYHLLPHFDRIIAISESGIAANGTYAEVVQKFPQYASMDANATDLELTSADTDIIGPLEKAMSISVNIGSLTNTNTPLTGYRSFSNLIDEKRVETKEVMTIEDRERGAVTLSTFVKYFNASVQGGHGMLILAFILLLFTVSQFARVLCDLWLGVWSRQEDPSAPNTYHKYFTGFIVINAICLFLTLVRSSYFVHICLGASRNMHDSLIMSILRAPVNKYFDVTPIGRILNKLSKDLDNMDSLLPDFFLQNLQNGFYCLFIVIVCVASSPYFILLLVPICYAFFRIQAYFRRSSRELKRLDGISRSPMYSFFSESLQGLTTIRAYGRAKIFTDKFFRLVDIQTSNFFAFWFANRWLAIRLDFVANMVIFAVGVLTTSIASQGGIIDPNYLGLALVYSLQLTGLLQWTVRVATEMESNMTSVERLIVFNEIEPEEPDEIFFSEEEQEIKTGVSKYIPLISLSKGTQEEEDSDASVWPSKGEIIMRHLSVRYRPGLELVLNDLNLVIPGGAKVGVCGRTGAGKSSLMLALFRLVQPEEGSEITVDGVNIFGMTLNKLRSNLTIIPQDPVMFSGTLRSNLDPFHLYSDAQLWESLDRAHLKDEIMQKFPLKLEHEVAEQGSNMSVGQRQLICIARALLRKSKVIVMDEATASVDSVTDQKIQTTIRNEFRDCTVLTIAHRLETIADYDLVVVMESGKVAESGSPYELLKGSQSGGNKDHNNDDDDDYQVGEETVETGKFLGMVNELGPERRAAVMDIALRRANEKSVIGSNPIPAPQTLDAGDIVNYSSL